MRLAPLSALSGALLDFSTSDDIPTTGFGGGTSSPIALGTIMEAAPTDGVDTGTNVPNWGLCELLYVANSSTAIIPGTVVVVDKDFNIVVRPITANTGRPCYVALTNFAVGSTTRQGGWVLASGICPATYSVAATAGPVFGGTAGNFTPTPAAGLQILNATCLIAAASAFTRAGCNTQNLGLFLRMPRVNGCFVGQTVSGTGIPASTEIASIDPGGLGVTLNNAMTATGTITATFTPTGFGIVHLSRPFTQGQIT
jgi:hypothetical protein